MRKTYFESAPAAAPNPIDFPALVTSPPSWPTCEGPHQAPPSERVQLREVVARRAGRRWRRPELPDADELIVSRAEAPAPATVGCKPCHALSRSLDARNCSMVRVKSPRADGSEVVALAPGQSAADVD